MIGVPRRELAALVIILAAALAFRLRFLSQPGLSADEDIAVLVIGAIGEHGVTRLPSGFIYDRGLPYSYLSWLAGAAFGQSVVTYRSVALVFGLLTIVAGWLAARRLLSRPAAALFAAALLAVLPLHIDQSVWARFYSLFCAIYLVAVVAIVSAIKGERPLWHCAALAAMCRFSHDLGASILIVPIAFAAAEWPDLGRSRRAAQAFVATAIGLLAAIWMLQQFRALGPPQFDETLAQDMTIPAWTLARVLPGWALGITVVSSIAAFTVALARKRRAWATLAPALVFAVAGELGLASIFAFATLLTSARYRGRIALAAAIAVAISWSVWALAMSARLQLGLGSVTAMLLPVQFSYPVHGLWLIAKALPILSVLLLCAVAASLRRESRFEFRVLLVVALGWWLMTSIGRHGFPPRYIAVVGILSAPAAAGSLLLLHSRTMQALFAAAAVTAIVTVSTHTPERIDHPSLRKLAAALPQNTVVVCNQDLTTTVYLGRCDYQLGADQMVPGAPARATTRLLGTPIVASLQQVAALAADHEVWLVLVRTPSMAMPDRPALQIEAAMSQARLTPLAEDASTVVFAVNGS